MKYRMVSSREWSYDVEMRCGLAGDGGALAEEIGGRGCLVVTTPTVLRLYRALFHTLEGVGARIFATPGGETNKTLERVSAICSAAADAELSRGDLMIGIGGGVCTDLSTLSASMLRRGIHHIKVPTTLIGLIDAGVGVKGGVNLDTAKNYLGCFHPPAKVFVDRSFLLTLPSDHIRYGLAEAVKIALVRSEGLLALLREFGAVLVASHFAEPESVAQEVVASAIELMLDELRENLFEDRQCRRAVDLGHTFSPLIEGATGFRLHHGAAVAIDLALSTGIAEELELCALQDRAAILDSLQQLGLPVHHPCLTPQLCGRALRHAARHRGGQANLVVPAGVGRVTYVVDATEVTTKLLDTAIGALADRSTSQAFPAPQMSRLA